MSINDLDEQTPISTVDNQLYIPVGAIGSDMTIMQLQTLLDYVIAGRVFKGAYDTYADLIADIPSPDDLDMYYVRRSTGVIGVNRKTKGFYQWDATNSEWIHAPPLADMVRLSDIINSLTSTDTGKPLAANQGKVLNDKITTLENNQFITALYSDTAADGTQYYGLNKDADDNAQWQVNKYIYGNDDSLTITKATINNNSSYANIANAWTVRANLNYA